MRYILLVLFLFSIQTKAADALSNLEIKDVIVGNSSAFQDATWFRVQGLVGHSSCQYSPLNVTLFYAKNDGVLSANKALPILMAAKLAGRKISIQYSREKQESDLWGFGISECELVRISLL